MSGRQPTADAESGLTRRSLLKTAAAGVAASTAGCSAPSLTGASSAASSTGAGDTATAYGNCWQCHKLCGMEVELNEDGTAEELHGIDGHPRGSAGEGTKGTLCPKGLSQLEKAYSPQRIKQPHVRKDGELRKVEWAEAYEYAAKRLQEFDEKHGAESLVEFHGWGTAGTFSTLF
ncbi:MAG: thiosulfate reductase/polysulfide reductase chain A, partial [Halobacteriales archaeon]